MSSNPLYGFCKCGCGQRTSIIKETRRSAGYVKGEPYPFVRGHKGRSLSDRFWSKVRIADNNACWIWQGTISTTGYGAIGVKGKTLIASRVAWELTYGTIPVGSHVCHQCDNPKCVNPSHLFLGSPKTNSDDKIAKGRWKGNKKVGNDRPQAKLTPADVLRIRELAASGVSHRKIAKMYPVEHTAIDAIILRKTWKHVT